jgi:hypothetical protein
MPYKTFGHSLAGRGENRTSWLGGEAGMGVAAVQHFDIFNPDASIRNMYSNPAGDAALLDARYGKGSPDAKYNVTEATPIEYMAQVLEHPSNPFDLENPAAEAAEMCKGGGGECANDAVYVVGAQNAVMSLYPSLYPNAPTLAQAQAAADAAGKAHQAILEAWDEQHPEQPPESVKYKLLQSEGKSPILPTVPVIPPDNAEPPKLPAPAPIIIHEAIPQEVLDAMTLLHSEAVKPRYVFVVHWKVLQAYNTLKTYFDSLAPMTGARS